MIVPIVHYGPHYCNWPRVAETELRSFDEEAMGQDEVKSTNESRWTVLMLLYARPTNHLKWQLVAASDVKCWQVPDVLLYNVESHIGIKVNNGADANGHILAPHGCPSWRSTWTFPISPSDRCAGAFSQTETSPRVGDRRRHSNLVHSAIRQGQ